jgi:hypothetical protein
MLASPDGQGGKFAEDETLQHNGDETLKLSAEIALGLKWNNSQFR